MGRALARAASLGPVTAGIRAGRAPLPTYRAPSSEVRLVSVADSC